MHALFSRARVLPALILIAALTACGGSDEDNDSPSTGSPGTTNPVPNEPGTNNPDTGNPGTSDPGEAEPAKPVLHCAP